LNTRRKLVIALGAGALVAPFASLAQQQGKVFRVGLLYVLSRQSAEARNRAFLEGMRELGYIEGGNLVVDWRFADGKIERLPDLAKELVELKASVIVTAGSPATHAAQKATTTIPIVMGNGSDPVLEGFVNSLAHPGGNITGLTNIARDIGPKHLEMLLNMAPKLSRVAVLQNPANVSHAALLKNIQAAAQKTGATIQPVEARNPQEITNAFATMSKEKSRAVILLTDGLFTIQRSQISSLALKYRLLSISVFENYAEAGGLMSYGTSITEQSRRAAAYVDKILKGAKPADLPVEQPTKFELIINGKTAKTLGLRIPQSLLISADKVIE
jgi:putative ABC transport system substrate-binding protein